MERTTTVVRLLSMASKILTGAAGMRAAALAIGALILLMPTISACGGGSKLVGAVGRNLEIQVAPVTIAERVAWQQSDGTSFAIRPRASNRRLALVSVTVVNRTSTIVPLAIDLSAARIGDRRGERIPVQDPFESANATNTPPTEEEYYLPFLWGEIELEKETQVTGWMVFDVPKGLRLTTLWWSEVDDIIANLVKRDLP